MRFALYLPNFGPLGDVNFLTELAVKAEKAGWDGFFIWDHIAGDAYAREMVDPWVALASIALRTEKIRIGALVTPLPRRRPWKVAREAVTLDHLSGGRLIFGAGSGGVGAEWERLGEVPISRQRGEMLDEGLQILEGLWSGELFSFHGKHYQVDQQQFLPKPLQSPRIPIWIAGKWPNKKPFLRGIKYDGVFPIIQYEPSYLNPPPEIAMAAYEDFQNWILSHAEGNAPLDMICRGNSRGGENSTPDAMISKYADLGYTWWLEHLVPEVFGGAMLGDWPLERMVRRIDDGPPV